MTKSNRVTDVGIAIEKLADALDPERSKPFGGDILDLLEWAARDVLKLRADIDQLCLQLAEAQAQSARRLEGLYKCGIEKDQLRQQLAKINDTIYAVGAPLGSEAYFTIRNICCDNAEKKEQ